ncbi:MAG: PSD1 domain-containing protein [Planctomycetes bacterium]|nr:PSD1 domain-containing protein [Planctomycetota bacterium]
MKHPCSLLLGLTVAVFLVAAACAAAAPEAVEFFEREVRPILATRCFECHGTEAQESGLRLDSRAGVLKGGEGGAAVVPGKPDESRLAAAIRYDGRTQMPPDGKLPQQAIDTLRRWIEIGAPWPAEAEASATVKASYAPSDSEAIAAAKESHWAFQAVKRLTIPALTPPLSRSTGRGGNAPQALTPTLSRSTGRGGNTPVHDSAWPATDVDRFVLAKLESQGLTPSPAADRRTLLRRATYDLIGLPPTAEEVAAFEADTRADAFAHVVERLLASPHYGERWGRYWLDVARYADTKGYVFQEERRYPFSHTYRDYVIRAFNEDLPYDRFLIEQIAADQLDLGEDKRPLAAMGFLTLGRRFLNNQADIIDDRIDVVMRGTQGLTVACARCHDHKFDPIPTADYYSLYGVFASSEEPRELPAIALADSSPAAVAYLAGLQEKEEEVAKFLQAEREKLIAELPGRTGDYLLFVHQARGLDEEDAQSLARRQRVSSQVALWWRGRIERAEQSHDPVFATWLAFAAIPEKEFSAQAAGVVQKFTAGENPEHPIHPAVVQAFSQSPPATLREAADRYGKLFAEVDELRQSLQGADSPALALPKDIERALDRPTRNKYRELQQKVDRYKATTPGAPDHAMVLVDLPQPVTPRIFVRGNSRNPGAAVPRRFPAVLASAERPEFQRGSGRLELAEAIASRDNPLTARVLVNRVWLHHFGSALVATPSDFGKRSEPPTHPELLDYLAWEFMERGWSIKELHRLIMLSHTYQQASDFRPEGQRLDPENRWLWRANRRRLDFEALRDSLLFASGRLDTTVGGRSVDLTKEPFAARRTIYGYVDRQNLQSIFRTFDFASPDSSSPGRHATTIPQQALFMLNSPFAIEQARGLMVRDEIAEAASPEARIERLHQLLFGRGPEPDEVRLGLRFVDQQRSGSAGLSAWELYAQTLLLSNEFAFVD